MSEAEALQIAIDTMRTRGYLAESDGRDWRKYGETLVFNRTEARTAAEYADRMNEASAVLQTMLNRLKKDATP